MITERTWNYEKREWNPGTDLRGQLDLTATTATMLTSENHLLKDIGVSLGYLHSKLAMIETHQYSIESKLASSKFDEDTKEALERLMKFTIKIHSDVVEGLYTLELSVQSYMADMVISKISQDFVDEHGGEEEVGNELNIQLFDFTNGNKPEISELDY